MNSRPPRLVAALAFAALALAPTFGRAGEVAVESRADKNVAQQAKQKAPFPFHLSLTAGYDSLFIFRGIDILPEQTVNPHRGFVQGVQQFLLNSVPGLSRAEARQAARDVVDSSLNAPRSAKIARESGIGYFDANVSFSPSPAFGTLTAGAFYAIQTDSRIVNRFFGDTPLFNDYTELDLYTTYSRSFGPVNATIGGTYYHVRKSSSFDTFEINFGLAYTPPKFSYLTASFSYDYTGSINQDIYDRTYAPDSPGYLDGHYLEARLTGNIPIVPRFVTLNPYVLLSAGSGIVPRAFDVTQSTFFTDPKFRAFIAGIIQAQLAANGDLSGNRALQNAQNAINPATLDREFDLNNFQVGVRLPINLGRYVTLTGQGAYTHPLGNLRGEPYAQKDNLWGGVNLNFFF